MVHCCVFNGVVVTRHSSCCFSCHRVDENVVKFRIIHICCFFVSTEKATNLKRKLYDILLIFYFFSQTSNIRFESVKCVVCGITLMNDFFNWTKKNVTQVEFMLRTFDWNANNGKKVVTIRRPIGNPHALITGGELFWWWCIFLHYTPSKITYT